MISVAIQRKLLWGLSNVDVVGTGREQVVSKHNLRDGVVVGGVGGFGWGCGGVGRGEDKQKVRKQAGPKAPELSIFLEGVNQALTHLNLLKQTLSNTQR